MGLRDLNPERVLRWCEHLYVEVVNQSYVGRLLMLPIGHKVLYCRSGGAVFDMELDRAHATYKDRHCKGCKKHKPLPDDWKCTREWSRNREIPREMEEAICNFRKST